jgi:para-nitrobenzyl esterase
MHPQLIGPISQGLKPDPLVASMSGLKPGPISRATALRSVATLEWKARAVLAAAAVAWLACGMAASAAKPAVQVTAGEPIQTDKGKVLGLPTADGKVLAFKGIPYATPPVADLRWTPPQPAPKWKKVLMAQQFGYHCVQTGGYPDMVFHDPGESEDCLTLNVWAPIGAKLGSLPVMVWVYRGGFTTGGTSENRQDGQFLAHRGVVVVSMNYRLGILGFLAHPELTAEQHGASGNYGLMDQAAALAWVRENIAGFGGNPANVTIFGESAGSESVSALMASPLAQGLFAKAIGESGGAFSRQGFKPREDAEKETTRWADRVFGTSRLFYLRTLKVEELMRAAMARTTPPPPRFAPDIDGRFLPDSPPDLYAGGRQAHVPLLAGWNADEQRGQVLNARPRVTAASFAAQAQAEFGEDAGKFLAVYPGKTDEEALRSAADYAGDKFIAYSTWAWIEAQTKTGGAPVYRYFFELPTAGDGYHSASAGAFHSDDIEYVFGTLASRPGAGIRPQDEKLSEQMGEYWTNFAKTGDPNGPGTAGTSLPKWPVYTPAGKWQVMHLDATSQAWPDALRERYLFLDGEWGRDAPR